MLDIAPGRSKYTNGMTFYNPVLDCMSVLADFYWTKIDILVKYLIASDMIGINCVCIIEWK